MKHFITFIVCTLISASTFAQSKSDWKETAVVEIPNTMKLQERQSSRSENIIYYFDIQGVKVSVSKSNAEKFKKGEITLLLVEWENQKTHAFRYTTRQKPDIKVVKRIKMESL